MATVQHANFIENGRKRPMTQMKEIPNVEARLGRTSLPFRSKQGVKVLQRKEYERIYSLLNAKESRKAEHDRKNKEKQLLKELRY